MEAAPRLTISGQAAIFAALLAVSLLLRLPSFPRSVLDWDESLYFLIAQEWRAGHLPYTTIWDNKPLGIYAIFAAFQSVFGARVLAIRLATAGFAAFGAAAVVNAVLNLRMGAGGRRRFAAGFAGLTYLVGGLSNDGLAANTELFMAGFTALAAAIATGRFRRPAVQAALTGLCLGLAFMVKYVAVFEAPAIGLLLLSRHPSRLAWRLVPAAVLGAALPVAAAMLPYAGTGLLGLWWADSVVANLRRLAPPTPQGALRAALALQAVRWGPLYALAAAVLAGAAWRLARRARRDQPDAGGGAGDGALISLWLLGAAAGAASAKLFFDHYFLQMLPALCVAVGLVFTRFGRLPPPALAAAAAAVLALPAYAGWIAERDALRPLQGGNVDTPAAVARDIAAAATPAQREGPAPLIYVFDYQPIIYALAKAKPPTPYVLPSILTGTFLAPVAGVDAPAEVQRILSLEPAFIVRNRHPGVDPRHFNRDSTAALDAALAQHYGLWRSYGEADVYALVR